jgi:hypothetical protein
MKQGLPYAQTSNPSEQFLQISISERERRIDCLKELYGALAQISAKDC